MNALPTDVIEEQPQATAGPLATPGAGRKAARQLPVQPVLERLYALYPKLFGSEFLPLKLGVFQDLLLRHPEHFERAPLKAALAVHTRSTRYLQSIADGKPRYSLDGEAVDALAPEHVYLALIELFRRRKARSPQDLRPRLRQQLIRAFEASGLSRQDYLIRVQSSDLDAYQQLEEALAELDQRLAREEALRNAFTSSGKAAADFAQMYGLDPADVANLLK